MNKEISIGLMGLNFGSTNLGCQALALSFYNDITNILKKLNIKCVFYAISLKSDFFHEDYPIVFQEYHLSNIISLINSYKILSKCDIVFDFTEGDSFSDIYGRSVFYKSAILKLLIENNKNIFILGPQTYGPYYKKDCKYIAKRIVEKADYVFSRDELSEIYLKEIGVKNKIKVITDIAFNLPFDKEVQSNNNKIKIGLNISGLLWENAESNNRFLKMKTDYIEFTYKLIEVLTEDPRFEIYLIPHVGNKIDEAQSDYRACYIVKQKFSQCILCSGFDNAISAKNFLSSMDIIIAGRMHASIGSFSSGVFTIPFAYSRKFQGYYQNLNYPLVVDGVNKSTEESLKLTLLYINQYKSHAETIKNSNLIAKNRLNEFYKEIQTLIEKI